MKRYAVTVRQIRVREVEIDATDEKEAAKKAIRFVKQEGLINHKAPTWQTDVKYSGELK